MSNIALEYKLNYKQKITYNIIAEYFINRYILKRPTEITYLNLLMTGPGGTGKTHVVRAVQQLMQYFNCGYMIRFLAPTGSAASLIEGMTIHKGLGIKIQSKNEKV